MKYYSFIVVLVIIALVGIAPQSFAAGDTILKIEGVKGESKIKNHQNDIDVLAWSFGASQSGTTHMGRGGGSGKSSIQDLSITKWTDSATPSLVKAVVSGKHYEKATLVVHRAGVPDKQAEYFVIIMEDVMVTGVSMAGSGGEERLTENITLNFRKFHISYRRTKKDGSAAAPVEVKWDIAKNVAY